MEKQKYVTSDIVRVYTLHGVWHGGRVDLIDRKKSGAASLVWYIFSCYLGFRWSAFGLVCWLGGFFFNKSEFTCWDGWKEGEFVWVCVGYSFICIRFRRIFIPENLIRL